MKREDLRPVGVKLESGDVKSGLFHQWVIAPAEIKGFPPLIMGIVEIKTENGLGKIILMSATKILFTDGLESEV